MPVTSQPTYRDQHAPIPSRVADLLTGMTRAEKVGQMMALPAIGGLDLAELITGFHVGSILHSPPSGLGEAIDLAAGTRLGIPLLIGDDAIHGHSFWPGATILGTQMAQACSWDPALVERAARMVATEVAATGLHWTFSPVLCIARDLRWGRVGETYGEDPHLIGELAAATVRGYQGSGRRDPTAILACAKHFAGYSQTQGGRDAAEADISRRQLRSWFLPPFELVARAGCATFMLGYQAMDGVPITVNGWLLEGVLRGEWGYSGLLVTDWDNVGRMVWEQRIMPDHREAAAAAVLAGNDLVMATPGFYEGALAALESGLLPERAVDGAVARILGTKFELGLFEDPRRPDPARQAAVINCPEHAALNLELARRGLVMLRNDGTLPLDPRRRGLRLAVVGPNADDPDAQLGDWAGASGQVDWLPDGHPRHLVETVLDGFRAVVPAGWEVLHARGADIIVADEAVQPAGWKPVAAEPSPSMVEQALAVASHADLVIAVVGDTIGLIGECRSTATLELVGGQAALLDALAASGTAMIVVLLSSKPMVLPDSALAAAALIWAPNPGMRGGRAIAELVLGLVEPAGRLPITFPRHVGQHPVHYNQVRGQHGDGYADLTGEPQFPFGFGLSYTTVAYRDLVIETHHVPLDGTVRATVTVANTGPRPALETVQVYVSDLVTSATWADRELKLFQQVWLEPGESRGVALELPAAACSLVDAVGRRVVEPGEFQLLVGPSSAASDLLKANFWLEERQGRPGGPSLHP